MAGKNDDEKAGVRGVLEREERKQKGYAERWKRRDGEAGGNQPASQPGKQLAHNLTEEMRERNHKT